MTETKKLMSFLLAQVPVYTFNESTTPVHFISSQKEWIKCAIKLKKAVFIGFDTETRPVFNKKQPSNRSSLLQIAVRYANHKEEVFILDLLTLPVSQFNSTLVEIFLSNHILKLGQGFYHDLKELATSYPMATCFQVAKRVLEVNDLSSYLHGGHHPMSLQKLVFYYLNQKLSKTQQTSNWNRRPLTKSQLHYAASDALVLLHLYDELLLRYYKKYKESSKTVLSSRLPKSLEILVKVLDVQNPPQLRCSMCFETSDSKEEVKKHRKICIAVQNPQELRICTNCNATLIINMNSMKLHMMECILPMEIHDTNIKKRRYSMDLQCPTQSKTCEITHEILQQKNESHKRKRRCKAMKHTESILNDKITPLDSLWSQVALDHTTSPFL